MRVVNTFCVRSWAFSSSEENYLEYSKLGNILYFKQKNEKNSSHIVKKIIFGISIYFVYSTYILINNITFKRKLKTVKFGYSIFKTFLINTTIRKM